MRKNELMEQLGRDRAAAIVAQHPEIGLYISREAKRQIDHQSPWLLVLGFLAGLAFATGWDHLTTPPTEITHVSR